MMTKILGALRSFFSREKAIQSFSEGVLYGGLDPSQHELYYAALIDRPWREKPQDYPWPPGWTS